ncbi:MAG: hypothetical protein ACKO54_01695, partial [Alphaproteobacteria bacterium]
GQFWAWLAGAVVTSAKAIRVSVNHLRILVSFYRATPWPWSLVEACQDRCPMQAKKGALKYAHFAYHEPQEGKRHES